jgi:hypothetical protein
MLAQGEHIPSHDRHARGTCQTVCPMRDSNYLEVMDTTQGWGAGAKTDACKIPVVSWATHRIEAVADFNPARCPPRPGDKLAITVTNPQSMQSASVSVTATAN